MSQTLVLLVLLRGSSSALQAVTLVLVGRSASISEFGTLNAAQGIGLVLFGIADLGVGAYLLKSRSRGDAEAVARAVTLNTTSTLAAAIVAVGLAIGYGGEEKIEFTLGLVVLGIALGLEKNVDTLLSIPIADGSKWVPGASVLLRRLFGGLVTAAMLLSGTDPALAFGTGYLVSCGIAQLHIRHYLRGALNVRGVRIREAARAIYETWPFMLAFVAGQVRALDTSVVAAFGGSTSAGVYAAASRLSNPLQLIPTALAQVLMPRAVHRGFDYSRRVGDRLAIGAVGLAAIACSLIWIGSPLLELIYGSQYSGSGLTLFWSMEAMIMVSLAAPLSSLLQVHDRERFVGWTAIIFTAFALIAIAPAVYLGGSAAAAAAVALAFALRCVALLARLHKLQAEES